MRKERTRPALRQLLFWAICCDLGLVCKRLIAPAANLLTDSMRIPGGVMTSFSLVFLMLGRELAPGRFGGTLMGLTQSLIMLAMGHTGSMGVLAPIGYIVPGLVIDALSACPPVRRLARPERMALVNALAAASAAGSANLIVFHLKGLTLLLYIITAITTGAICGAASGGIANRVETQLYGGMKGKKRN